MHRQHNYTRRWNTVTCNSNSYCPVSVIHIHVAAELMLMPVVSSFFNITNLKFYVVVGCQWISAQVAWLVRRSFPAQVSREGSSRWNTEGVSESRRWTGGWILQPRANVMIQFFVVLLCIYSPCHSLLNSIALGIFFSGGKDTTIIILYLYMILLVLIHSIPVSVLLIRHTLTSCWSLHAIRTSHWIHWQYLTID